MSIGWVGTCGVACSRVLGELSARVGLAKGPARGSNVVGHNDATITCFD